MPNYGFLIDHRKCIGCHACSTACKAENEVPLGVYRTWVKYVETGAFPDTRRHFQVTRCNHCANPPCVRICPVTAMYQRVDGIVEFDPQVCIGCKACLQACPYDAIHIDPETHSAAKCHFCSHRVDIGLKPACEVVCPEQAIISGDLDDPTSTISQLVAREPVSVRKPEQGTAPKLFYINASEATLTPTVPQAHPSFVWADVVSDQARVLGKANQRRREIIPLQAAPSHSNGHYAASGAPIRTPASQGLGIGRSALMTSSRVAEQMVQTTYNAQHKIPWHWPVPAYLVTKAIGSGMLMTLALASGLGLVHLDSLFAAVTLFISLLFIGITTGLLVFDLEKPRMFITILTRPQWKSWLTRGAFVLIGTTVIAGLWFLVEVGSLFGLISPDIAILRVVLAWACLPITLLAAIYTAFLFAQAEGRDLWQSPLLPFHLLIQALMVGSGALLLVGLALPLPDGMARLSIWLFGICLIIDLFVTLAGEFSIPHANEIAARAAQEISHGRYRHWFWIGGIALGHLLPLALLALGLLVPSIGLLPALLGAPAAIAGLYAFEYAFVMAPQEIPNS